MKSMRYSGKPASRRALKLKGFSGEWQTGGRIEALLAGIILTGIVLALSV